MGHGLTPEQADRLIEGRGSEDPRSRALAGFVADLRSTFAVAPEASTRSAHLAAMARVQPLPAAAPARRPRRWLRGSVAAMGLVLVGGSAMAATGSLPEPLQDAVANGVDVVLGADLPGGDDEVAAAGTPTNERAAANKARSEAFTDAKKAWVECVRAAEDEAKADPEAEPVDREAVCGEKPHPHDYGIPAKNENADNTPKSEKTGKPEKTEKPVNTHKPVDPANNRVKSEKPVNTHKPVDPANTSEKTPKPAKTPKVPAPDPV